MNQPKKDLNCVYINEGKIAQSLLSCTNGVTFKLLAKKQIKISFSLMKKMTRKATYFHKL